MAKSKKKQLPLWSKAKRLTAAKRRVATIRKRMHTYVNGDQILHMAQCAVKRLETGHGCPGIRRGVKRCKTKSGARGSRRTGLYKAANGDRRRFPCRKKTYRSR